MSQIKKNICILSKDLVAGGAEKQALILANTLSSYHNVSVIVFKDIIHDRNKKFIEENHIPIQVLHGNFIVKSFLVYKILRKKNIDILISYLFKGNLVCGLVGLLAGVQVRIGGIRNAILNPKKERIERILHNRFNSLTIFNNYSGAELYAKRKFKPDKILVVPNCISFPDQIARKNSSDVKVLTVGRFVPQKDYYTAIKAFSQIIEHGIINVHYTIIGWGVLEYEIRRWIKEMKIEKYVSIIINPLNVLDYYKQADIYLSTSLFEGISNTIMEAMSYSLPCIVTDVGDNSRLIKNNSNGFVHTIKDIDGIANSLTKLMLNKKLREDFGYESYLKIKNEYSINHFTENYLKIIDNA